MIRWGSNDPRSEKSLPLSWMTGRLLGGADPGIQKIIERVLAKEERAELKQARKQ